MTDKLENIKNEEIKMNKNGEIELSDELANAVAGGFSADGEEAEFLDNCNCKIIVKK